MLVYQDAGWLGDGIACSKYVSGVGTNFTSLAIAAAYNCGIRDFDVQQGYEAALKNGVEDLKVQVRWMYVSLWNVDILLMKNGLIW